MNFVEFKGKIQDSPYILRRWFSDTKIWEITFRQMMYGIRVSVGRVDQRRGYAEYYLVDYCAGSEAGDLLRVLLVVLAIMHGLNESISDLELTDRFPEFKIKPVINDPNWSLLERQIIREQDK